LLSMNAVAIWK